MINRLFLLLGCALVALPDGASAASKTCSFVPSPVKMDTAATISALKQSLPAVKICFDDANKTSAKRDREGVLKGVIPFGPLGENGSAGISFGDAMLLAGDPDYFDAHAGRQFRSCVRAAIAATPLDGLNLFDERLEISFAYRFTQTKQGSEVTLVGAPKFTVVNLSADTIRTTIKANVAAVRQLYEALLEKSPDANGKVDLRFQIGIDGAVFATEIVKSTMNQAPFERQLLAEVGTWCFPTAQQHTTVNYPFVFSPG